MRKTFSTLVIFLITYYGLNAQTHPTKLNIHSITKSKLLKILKSESDYEYEEAAWTYFATDSTYRLKDTIVITNSYKYFFPKGETCYLTTWSFVNMERNHINISDGIFVCQEPPRGGLITFHVLRTDKKEHDLLISILNRSLQVEQQFKVLEIETIKTSVHNKSYRVPLPYRITLLRLQ